MLIINSISSFTIVEKVDEKPEVAPGGKEVEPPSNDEDKKEPILPDEEETPTDHIEPNDNPITPNKELVPQTVDNITLYISVLGFSIIGLTGAILYIKEINIEYVIT